jgi:hypothetical protein
MSVHVVGLQGLLAPWLGISADAWGGIIVAVAVAAIPTLLYRLGRIRPLVVSVTASTMPHSDGGDMTVVTITLRSRTRDTQTIRRIALAEWPNWSRRLRHPRWRTSKEGFNIKPFDYTSLNDGPLQLSTGNIEEITGETREYPPYNAATRILVQGIRERPILKQIKNRTSTGQVAIAVAPSKSLPADKD